MFSLCPLANHIRGPARQHTGHSSAHKYSEGRIFCHPEWEKGVTGSSTFCLWILSSTQYLCMQNGVFSRALRFDLHQTQREREVLAEEINVCFSVVSISNCSLFLHCEEKVLKSFGSTFSRLVASYGPFPAETSRFCQ